MSYLLLTIVAAYYFPGFHADPAVETIWGEGYTFWERVTEPPKWGYLEDDDPAAWDLKIDAAVDQGIDAFIFNWYWFDKTGPVLNGALERGYLKSASAHKLQFAIMWSNHDWTGWYRGRLKPSTYRDMMARLERHFRHPQYLRVDGRPYFSVYDVQQWIHTFGGLEPALTEIRRLQTELGLHVNLVVHGPALRSGGKELPWQAITEAADSVTVYTWAHWVRVSGDMSHETMARRFEERVPWLHSIGNYVPNVTLGWYSEHGRAHMDAHEAKKSLLQTGCPELVTLNAWNEWGEGSYSEPSLKERPFDFGACDQTGP